jgi:hypothetical protein
MGIEDSLVLVRTKHADSFYGVKMSLLFDLGVMSGTALLILNPYFKFWNKLF